MSRIAVERRPQGFPWWAAILGLLLLLLLGGLIWYLIAGAGDQERRQAREAERGRGPMDLQTVLSETGMPREFNYRGTNWTATEVGRFGTDDGLNLTPTGQSIQGRELYREQGASDEQGGLLYLAPDDSRYENTYIRYMPAREPQPGRMGDQQGR